MKRNWLLSILAALSAALMPLAASCQVAPDRPPAAAQPTTTYKWEGGVGYAYTSLNQVNQSRYGLEGVNVSLTRDFGQYFGLIADGSFYFRALKSGNPVNAKMDTVLFGPVVHMDLFGPYSGFLRGFIGGEHTGGASEYPKLAFAGGIGGGMEYKLNKRLSLRAAGDEILSAYAEDPNQLGYSPHTRGNPRASFGVVYHF